MSGNETRRRSRPGDISASEIRYPWRQAPEWWIFHPGINGPALRTALGLAALAARARRREDDQDTVAMGREHIAHLLGISPDTFDRHATMLSAAGALTIYKQTGTLGEDIPNEYVVHREPQDDTLSTSRNLREAEQAAGMRDDEGRMLPRKQWKRPESLHPPPGWQTAVLPPHAPHRPPGGGRFYCSRPGPHLCGGGGPQRCGGGGPHLCGPFSES